MTEGAGTVERRAYGQEDLVLIGRPFAPIGMGELLRASRRAFREARVPVKVLDIYGMDEPDPDTAREFGPDITTELGRINIFHLNGDEIETAMQRLGTKVQGDDYKILYPTWELSRYPDEWARSIDHHFDEVWACSTFVRESISASVSVPVLHLPLAVQPRVRSFLSRRYFGIPETCYAFLFSFDFTSYIERKNPFAGLSAFERLLRQRPNADVVFVVKLNSSAARPDDLRRFMEFLEPVLNRLVIIDRTLTDNEVKNLHLCCDAFVSLHRSEGFGFGCAEAMFFGKPVISTAYSGNMDFMTSHTALLVNYELVPVPPGAYPHGEGQVWADPDIEQAAGIMAALVDNRAVGVEVGQRATVRLRTHFSHRAVGLRYDARVQRIFEERPALAKQRRAAFGDLGEPGSTCPKRDGVPQKVSDIGTLSDDAWLATLIAAAEGAPLEGYHLPPFPAPQWQAMFVGSSNAMAMREAFTFYVLLKDRMARNGTPLGRRTRVLDFGCGWGRYIRLFMKDIDPDALHGADVDPDMIGFCRISGLPAQFSIMPPLGPTEYSDGSFDLVFAYSVFSHLSESAFRKWMQEFARILRPGGIVVFTTQTRRFLEWTAQLREQPESELTDCHKSLRSAFPDLGAALTDYDAGRFIFAPTGGGEHRPSSFYGEAAIPEVYLRQMRPNGLTLLEFTDDPGTCPQAVVIFQRTPDLHNAEP